jgi:hypothetical protein
MMEIPLKDKMNVYNLTISGVTMDDIVFETGIHYKKVSSIIKEMSEIVYNNNRPTKLGRKDEPYYECEEDYGLTPVYEWNDLNLNEIEFYEKYGKGRKKS